MKIRIKNNDILEEVGRGGGVDSCKTMTSWPDVPEKAREREGLELFIFCETGKNNLPVLWKKYLQLSLRDYITSIYRKSESKQ